jgi:hypothetical protein
MNPFAKRYGRFHEWYPKTISYSRSKARARWMFKRYFQRTRSRYFKNAFRFGIIREFCLFHLIILAPFIYLLHELIGNVTPVVYDRLKTGYSPMHVWFTTACIGFMVIFGRSGRHSKKWNFPGLI